MIDPQLDLLHNTLEPLQAQDKSLLWIGAASFEERSCGSLIEMKRNGFHVTNSLIITYDTKIMPGDSAEKIRHQNTQKIINLSREVSLHAPEQVALPAYAFGAAQRAIRGQLADHSFDGFILDITCMTKVHALAIAAELALNPSRTYLISYTIPENYPGISDPGSLSGGWKDIIIAPLSESARFFNENNGRGVILIGHEADRLIVALAEIEPSGGTIALASSPRRPDLGEVSIRRNARIIRQLTRMRVADWTKEWVSISNLRGIASIVAREVSKAEAHSAPVILFPYGPKPLVFMSAYSLAQLYYENSWFVYPIPESYDAAYSEGISEVTWFIPTNSPTA